MVDRRRRDGLELAFAVLRNESTVNVGFKNRKLFEVIYNYKIGRVTDLQQADIQAVMFDRVDTTSLQDVHQIAAVGDSSRSKLIDVAYQ